MYSCGTDYILVAQEYIRVPQEYMIVAQAYFMLEHCFVTSEVPMRFPELRLVLSELEKKQKCKSLKTHLCCLFEGLGPL